MLLLYICQRSVICHNPPLPGLPDQALPVLNQSQQKIIGALVQSNHSVIQLLLYDIRLKKKILCLKACENFSNRRGMRFFILKKIFFYFNWPLPPRTSKTKNDWKVSTPIFSEIKWDFTRFLSSHVLKFFQNSKLSSFFVVKMKKKKFKKKNESLNFAKSNAHRKTNAGGSFETQNFFFSLITMLANNKMCLKKIHNECFFFSLSLPTDVLDKVSHEIVGAGSRLFAVIFIQGHQYKVTTNDLIQIGHHIEPDIGERIRLEKVWAKARDWFYCQYTGPDW